MSKLAAKNTSSLPDAIKVDAQSILYALRCGARLELYPRGWLLREKGAVRGSQDKFTPVRAEPVVWLLSSGWLLRDGLPGRYTLSARGVGGINEIASLLAGGAEAKTIF